MRVPRLARNVMVLMAGSMTSSDHPEDDEDESSSSNWESYSPTDDYDSDRDELSLILRCLRGCEEEFLGLVVGFMVQLK